MTCWGWNFRCWKKAASANLRLIGTAVTTNIIIYLDNSALLWVNLSNSHLYRLLFYYQECKICCEFFCWTALFGKTAPAFCQYNRKWFGVLEKVQSRFILLLPCDIHPLMFVLQKSSLGDVLYQRVFYHLDLLETSYFGLQYTDASNVNVSLTYWVRLGSGDLM